MAVLLLALPRPLRGCIWLARGHVTLKFEQRPAGPLREHPRQPALSPRCACFGDPPSPAASSEGSVSPDQPGCENSGRDRSLGWAQSWAGWRPQHGTSSPRLRTRGIAPRSIRDSWCPRQVALPVWDIGSQLCYQGSMGVSSRTLARSSRPREGNQGRHRR